ncbi:hypothetical protein ACWDUL_08840 [Nocardia niigatensis]
MEVYESGADDSVADVNRKRINRVLSVGRYPRKTVLYDDVDSFCRDIDAVVNYASMENDELVLRHDD